MNGMGSEARGKREEVGKRMHNGVMEKDGKGREREMEVRGKIKKWSRKITIIREWEKKVEGDKMKHGKEGRENGNRWR